MQKKWLLFGALAVGILASGGWWYVEYGIGWINPRAKNKIEISRDLAKYDFDNLRKRPSMVSEIEILGPIEAVEDRRKSMGLKYENIFSTREISFVSNGKKISGMINYYPERSSLSPVVIMIRGYAEPVGYYPGSGTWRVADRLADMGIMTVSLDFLGYANSEIGSTDVLEARFEKVPAVLDLIASVKNLPFVDSERIGIWAHSNGGQIALSVLEVTGANYPTSLWAPMTNPFPQSVYETLEEGSMVKEILDEFGKHYDYRRYAFENYYAWINAPVMIHQGTADEWCEVEWQEEVVNGLKEVGKDADLYIYEGDDHNFSKNWEEVVARDLGFFERWF